MRLAVPSTRVSKVSAAFRRVRKTGAAASSLVTVGTEVTMVSGGAERSLEEGRT